MMTDDKKTGTRKVRKRSTAAEEKHSDPKELRRHRARMLRDKAKESQEKRQIHGSLVKTSEKMSVYFLKLYIVVGTAIIVTLFAILNHVRPKFLFGDKTAKKIRPFRLSSIYPPEIVPDRDLPRFFRTYSIATPDNIDARSAMVKAIHSRKALRQSGATFKVYVRTWDSTDVTLLLDRGVCGDDFGPVYYSSSDERKNDLVMWCFLGEHVAEGFYLNNMEFVDSPLSLTQGKGIVIKSVASPEKSLSNSFYLHPRDLMKEEQNMSIIPSKVLTWMLDHPETEHDTYKEYRQKLSEYLHDLIFDGEGTEDHFMILDEICQPFMPLRTVAKACEEDSCCYIVVPEQYGGFMNEESSDED
jgi:hypothetical protein